MPDDLLFYLLHLVQERHVSWSDNNQTVAARRVLYEVTLQRQGVMTRIRCPKVPKKRPVILSQDEVTRVLAAVESIEHRALLMTAQNPRVVYGLLFRAASEFLLQVAADPDHLRAENRGRLALRTGLNSS